MELARRFRYFFVLKTVTISLLIWVFFICYFYVLHNPVHTVTIMPLTWLDQMIPFQPLALVPYLSLWLYLGIAPGLMIRLHELLIYGFWISTLCLTGLFCFYAWPTAVPPLGIDISGHPGFALLQGVDAAGNACPSLHVATAMFSAIRIDRILFHLQVPQAPRLLNAAWFATITYSTIATRQHVVLDALAGALLGIGFAAASLRLWSGGARAPFLSRVAAFEKTPE
jgi:hypothetical protein